MEFYEPDFLEEILDCMSPEKFLNKMKEIGLVKEITEDYASDCYHLCRNATAHILSELKKSDEITAMIFLEEAKIIDGTFNGKHHTWILIGDYYIDLTLKQFRYDAPKLAVTLKEEVNQENLYQEILVSSVKEWVKKELSEEDFSVPMIDFNPEIEDAFVQINGVTIKI